MAYTSPGAYSSTHQNVINGIMDKINKRKEFNYDFNADPIYQQYKDQYTALGANAATNAASNAANLSGGYANSYATTAATQANQQYLSQLNDVIPQLYQAAQNQYNQETSDLYNQYSMMSDAENRDYTRWQDANSNYQWQKEYDAARDEFNKNYKFSQDQFAYTKQRDQVADSQWQKEFDENVRQFGLNYALSAAAASGSGSGGRSSGGRSSGGSSSSIAYTAASYVASGATANPLTKSTNATRKTTKSQASAAKSGTYSYKNPAAATTNQLASYFTGAKFAYNNNKSSGLTRYLNNLVKQGKISSANAATIKKQVKAGYTKYQAT